MPMDHACSGRSARSLPSVRTSAWYWRGSGMRPFFTHSLTLGGLMPNARAVAVIDPKCSTRMSGDMTAIIGNPIRVSIGNPYRLSGRILGMPTPRKEPATIGARIVAAREEAGLSQKELAKKLGITQPSLSDLERGESGAPRARTLLAMRNAGISQDYIMDGRGPKLLRDIELRLADDTAASMLRELSDEEHEVFMEMLRATIRKKGKPSLNDPYK